MHVMQGQLPQRPVIPGSVLREADRAPTESKVRVWSRSLNPIDSIGQLLSITVGRNIPAEGIDNPLHSYNNKV